jgi:hypothetical protein
MLLGAPVVAQLVFTGTGAWGGGATLQELTMLPAPAYGTQLGSPGAQTCVGGAATVGGGAARTGAAPGIANARLSTPPARNVDDFDKETPK